jgi:hypothetical protein
MESEGSLPCSQEPSTGPVQSNNRDSDICDSIYLSTIYTVFYGIKNNSKAGKDYRFLFFYE